MLEDEFKIKFLNKIGESIINNEKPNLAGDIYTLIVPPKNQIVLKVEKEKYKKEIKKKYLLDDSVNYDYHKERYQDIYKTIFLFFEDLLCLVTTKKEIFESKFIKYRNEKNKFVSKNKLLDFLISYFFFLQKKFIKKSLVTNKIINIFVHNNLSFKSSLEFQILISYIILLSKKITNYCVNNKKPNLTKFLNDLFSI